MEDQASEKEGLIVYETSYLILPSIPEDKLDEVVASIRKVIAKEGGVEIGAESPFQHPLSYSMSKTVGASRYVVSDAYIGWIKFEVDREKIAMIKAGLEKIEELLRFLIVKAPRETVFTFAKARAAMEEKEEKETEEPAAVEDPVVVKEAVVE